MFLQDLPIGSFSDTFQKSVEKAEDPLMKEIAKKYFSHYDFGMAFYNVSHNKIVMAESQELLEYNLRKSFTNE